MATGADLAQRIEEYLARASASDSERRDISKAILEAVEKELLPQLSPHLPQGYSVDLDQTATRFDERQGLNVVLRLLHDGKIFGSGGYGFKRIELEAMEKIHRETKSASQAFAKRYHLSGVYLGEDTSPAHGIMPIYERR